MKERISVSPQVHFGKPCVAGTRISVQSVLGLVREGLSFSQIIQDYYPDLETEDIRACIQYAIDFVPVEDIRLATTRGWRVGPQETTLDDSEGAVVAECCSFLVLSAP